ncbi:methylated-DNA--[protein]-cysteine S-methyltransferase [Antrihabitans cavernicola]|uniref:methylated-DNA--[protein]-cysteine S-methyltransferase n=1 Tax=Antrihabitans cavernicola TaxID=2495913 RepID=UPI001F2A2BBC|nr:methylated-DNA--[protein]-cysteine S-methyltransferase [Spelaeibacter cavernicola]
MNGYTLFDTAIGTCGIAWSGVGVVAFELPEATAADTEDRLRRVHRAAQQQPTPEIERAISAIVAHLDGSADDLRWIPLDLRRVTDFDRNVYAVTRDIDPGRTLTYGDVADLLELRGAAQAVGQSLGRNPIPLIVPCHRVLAAGNELRGFSAPGGTGTKRRLLAIEHAPGFDDPVLF